MGFLTTIVIHNDALGAFEADPLKFGQTILAGIGAAGVTGKATDMGFSGYANYIEVHPPRHADDTTVYLHSGNGVYNLNPYNKDMAELIERMPDVAESFIKKAQAIVNDAKRKLKEKKARDLTAAKKGVE